LIWGILILGIVFPGVSISQITFEKTYGGTLSDAGFSVHQIKDGGFIIAGYTWSFGSGWSDVYLIKTDPFGDTLWTKTYGDVSGDRGLSVRQTSDSGFIITGSKRTFSGGYIDVYLIKTDSFGDTLWTKTFGGHKYDYGSSVQQTSDGGFVIAGGTASFGAGGWDVYLIKTDSFGDTLWTRTFGSSSSDRSFSVQETSDGGFIIAGWTASFGAIKADVYIIRTDSSGDSLWTKTYGGSSYDFGNFVQQTSDGGFVIAGYTYSFGAGSIDIYLIRTNTLGDTLWTRTYGGTSNDFGNSVQQTSDGGFIISGRTESFGAGLNDVYLIKINSIGDTLWTRTFGGADEEWGNAVEQTTDGGFIIVGLTQSFGSGQSDVYLIKTEPFGIHCNTFDGLHQTITEAQIHKKGIRNSLLSKANNAKRQFDRGNFRASGNILCALLNEVNAQDGKHIEPNSAQEIRDCVLSLSGELEIPLPCTMRDKKGSNGERNTILWKKDQMGKGIPFCGTHQIPLLQKQAYIIKF
jgi:hypothetical protein